MKKLKTTKVEHLGKEYFFVSRDEFSDEEIQYYFDAHLYKKAKQTKLSDGKINIDDVQAIPDSIKDRFIDDMRVYGIDFCKNKYGMPKTRLIKEAARLHPGKDWDKK